MKEKKYKLTDKCIKFGGRKLYRIEALKDFSDIKKGDKGGFIEKEYNLSQEENCWVYDDAIICDNARVCNDAIIYDNAAIYGDATVYGNAGVSGQAYACGHAIISDNARVYDHAVISGSAKVCSNAEIFGDAVIYGNASISNTIVTSISDYIVFKNWWSSGRYFTWTRRNNMWRVGCFYGTGEELIAKAYKDNELKGKEYERVVKYVESIIKDNEL